MIPASDLYDRRDPANLRAARGVRERSTRRNTALRLDEFDNPSAEPRREFPGLTDATTTAGFARLRRELPDTWCEALDRAWASLPRATPHTSLHAVLLRGSRRVLPRDPSDAGLVSARRSALGRLCDLLPDLALRQVDARTFDRWVRDYRAARRDASAAIVSSDLTELRATVNAALAEAGLPVVRRLRAAQPRRCQGRAADRRVAGLDEVDRLLQSTSGPLQALILVRVATTAPDAAILRLRRGDLDLDAGRLRVDLPATRRPGSPPGHLLYGLPRWCVAQLRAALPGIDGWDEERLLFPAEGAPHRPRRKVSRAFRRLADGCGCSETTLRSLRRLAQAIHARAPRAVRRATATARDDVAEGVLPDEAALAAAQEAYAAWISSAWGALHAPPVELRRVARRAGPEIAPDRPEQARRKAAAAEPAPGRLVAGVRVEDAAEVRSLPRAGWTAAGPDRVETVTHPDVSVSGSRGSAGFGETGATALFGAALTAQAMQRADAWAQRARQAEAELAGWKERSVSVEDALVCGLFAASGAFAAGMSFEAWLASRPDVRERLGIGVGRFAVALGETMAEDLRRGG